jgi:hypothetical protein
MLTIEADMSQKWLKTCSRAEECCKGVEDTLKTFSKNEMLDKKFKCILHFCAKYFLLCYISNARLLWRATYQIFYLSELQRLRDTPWKLTWTWNLTLWTQSSYKWYFKI